MRREDEEESLHEFAWNFAARHAARGAARAPTATESGAGGDGLAHQPAKAVSADNENDVVRSGGEQDEGECLLEFARNFAARYRRAWWRRTRAAGAQPSAPPARLDRCQCGCRE